MPTLVDLFCGRGGWSRPALARGWRCIGYDIEDHGYPGELRTTPLPVALDELRQLTPDLIVASPPCQDFARACLPWLRTVEHPDTTLLRWSIGLHDHMACPVVIECSKFAARYVTAKRFTGSYALWGDVPAILPHCPPTKARKSGTDPAARAIIPHQLADWIIECHTPPLETHA